ncbi:MAG: hypothetical protein Q7R95_11410 [bacterium]|nr:hypothetical protein [bacterium]
MAIAPKVRLTNPWLINNKPEYNDNKQYFVNLIRAGQENDWKNRIRCNFVCVGKNKP